MQRDLPIVALDTNALMMPVQSDVDPFRELERLLGAVDMVIPNAVRTELERLAEDGQIPESRAARVGYRLARERCRELCTEHTGGDAALVALATDNRVDYVLTNDGPLRDRLHDVGIPVISLRGHNKLAVIHP